MTLEDLILHSDRICEITNALYSYLQLPCTHKDTLLATQPLELMYTHLL